MATRKVGPPSDEFAGADFGDVRIAGRLMRFATAVAKVPAAGLPEAAGSDGELEGVYRFLRNERVTPARILAPHLARTEHLEPPEPRSSTSVASRALCGLTPGVAVMEPADPWKADDAGGGVRARLDGTPERRVLVEPERCSEGKAESDGAAMRRYVWERGGPFRVRRDFRASTGRALPRRSDDPGV